MTVNTLVVILPLLTFALVLGLAYLSKRRTEDKLEDPQAKKSTLARDG